MSLLLSEQHKTPKLACFLHSTTLEIWKDDFLMTILKQIKSSGLLEKLDHFCIVNTGLPINDSAIEKDFYPAKVIHYSQKTNDFENVTIKLLYTFCRFNPDYKVLYMHTKGISYDKDHTFLPGIHSWNRFMMYGLVDNYAKCLRLMHIYDTVGSNYRPHEDGNNQHYSGNFWWASAKYISTLPISYMKNKYDPEFWLLQNKPMYFNIHTLEHMYQNTYPVENYCDDVFYGFGDNVLFCKVGFYGTGLCNQLYCIANTLCLAATQEGNKVVILDDFVADIFENNDKPSCDVLDLPKCNAMLKPYGITMMYKNHITMKLHQVLLGLRHVGTVDITKQVEERFWKDNHLLIPKGTFLTALADEDPCPNIRKQIYVYYYLNDVLLQEVFYEENLYKLQSLEINHCNYDGKPHMSEVHIRQPWLQRINRKDSRELRNLFDYFMKAFIYRDEFNNKAHTFLDHLCTVNPVSNKTHVVHLRNEIDAIKHWGAINSMSEDEYRELYETIVKELIREHIPKTDTILVLTADAIDNPVVDELRSDGFTLVLREKDPIGRDMNAIMDLLVGSSSCTGVFIGNFILTPDLGHQEGSTFSFTLYNSLREFTKVFMIDMDNLKNAKVGIIEK
jgi:hypothetical protein